MTSIQHKELESEIINRKKQFIFEVSQSNDSVLPNQKYRYQIYCKNISGLKAENVHIKVAHPRSVYMNESDNAEIISLGDLEDGQSHLLYLESRCSQTGQFPIHFICYADISGILHQTLTINCAYEKYIPELTHKIYVYNFTPYEDTYRMDVENYTDRVTQLFKKQKLPFKAGESFFKMQTMNDESQSYLDQLHEIKNQDEHGYSYLGRENFEISLMEEYEGKNLIDLLNRINQNSKYIRATYIRAGNNELLNDFKQFNPNGFIHRFGLLNSEIFHHIGVLPTFNYMNEYLFRWAPDQTDILNLYPEKKSMVWNTKKWSGDCFVVYELYDNNEQNIHTKKVIKTFNNEWLAKEFINKNIRFNTADGIEGYSYKIKEVYWNSGVFFLNIPISKIPSNFYTFNTEEIETIVNRAKPYGLKGLVRYQVDVLFNHNMEMTMYPRIKPLIELDLGEYDRIIYWIQSLKYQKFIEEICGTTVESYRLTPYGLGAYNGCNWDSDLSLENLSIKPNVVNSDKNNKALNIDMEQEFNIAECHNDNSLTTTQQIAELLYLNHFDNISFRQNKYKQSENSISKFRDVSKDIDYTEIKQYGDKEIEVKGVPHSDFKLWISALENKNTHLTLQLKKEDNTYFVESVNDSNKIDLLRLPLTNAGLYKTNIEVGIYIKDAYQKLHGFSAEYDDYVEQHYIKYSTSVNNNYKVIKEGYANIIGIAFKTIQYNNNTILIMYLEQEKDNKTSLNYFNHIILSDLKEIGVFVRNGNDSVYPVQSWYNLLYYGYHEESEVEYDSVSSVSFQTPSYQDIINCDDYHILDSNNGEQWTNLYRIDKAENSYAFIKNNTDDIITPNNISLLFDDLSIPDDAVVKRIKLKTIMESNAHKDAYCEISTQANIHQNETSFNIISLNPSMLECYHQTKESYSYYQMQKEIAESNQNFKQVKLFDSYMTENLLFDESLDYNTEYLNDIDNYITVKKPFWLEISDFTSDAFSFNNIKSVDFIIEGYNNGNSVNLISQLHNDKVYARTSKNVIETGYFRRKISIPLDLGFLLDEIKLRFRFESLNDDIKIYNTYIDVNFRNKIQKDIVFEETDDNEIFEKKIINFNIVNEDSLPHDFNNGLIVNLNFDDMYPGEEYRIYSVELDVLYQLQSINMLINRDEYNRTYSSEYTTVTGKENDALISGVFFDDKPILSQSLCKRDYDDKGFELTNKLYQSFTALSDNITSIGIHPNGFYGSPSSALKIKIYENNGTTPGRVIKEVFASGWSKENEKLKYLDYIKYNIPVNNLKIGETYWFSIEVVNPDKNSGYYLSYNNEKVINYKLLYSEDGDLRNVFGALQFDIYCENIVKSFNHIPTTQNYFNDPYIMLGLNRGQGSISNLRVQKSR